MAMDETVASLLSANQRLRRKNDHLKLLQLSLVRENLDLRARVDSFSSDSCESVCSPSGRNVSTLRQNTADEEQFRKDLEQTKNNRRTSSPVDFKSFLHTSAYVDTDESAECQSCQADTSPGVKGPKRLLGEIAYQLDMRILSHIFQDRERLYGFNVSNIQDKIIVVATHHLTGKVDEGYRLHLTQRHADLMERLKPVGYKAALHPAFTEFIVNTYGILKERPGELSTHARDYNNPDFLRKLIMTVAPKKLQRDLCLVLTCLCNMAEMDRKPLLLW